MKRFLFHSGDAVLKYENRIREIHKKIGIPDDYGAKHGLALQYEEVDLFEIGNDVFGRVQKLSKKASAEWNNMKSSAESEGVFLDAVSAFRSVEKQTRIIMQKLDKGQAVSEILEVSAAPGYSEHHTGRAIDITTPCCEPLSESFELTKAFRWLHDNAYKYSFKLSYPKGNSYGISYEPWHWIYSE